MKKSLLLLLMSLSFTLTGRAQTFSNLGFEYWQAEQFPLFWQHPGISVSADPTVKFAGRYSLKAVRGQEDIKTAKIPYGLLMQDVRTAFEIDYLNGKTLEISAQIRCKSADTAAHVCVFVQIIDPINPAINKIVFGNNVAADSGWTRSAIEITIDKTTPHSLLLMGVVMAATGELWVDDYQIKFNGLSPTEIYPRTADLSKKELKWLSSNIIPIKDEKLTDAQQFAKSIDRAQVVGVGDNVHGSATVFRLKNIISRNLIENDGFTLLAVEDSPCVGESLNRYVLGLADTVAMDMNVMYTNPEFKAFLSWLRDYNKSAAQKVRIFGTDVNVRYENQIKHLDRCIPNFSAQLDSVRSILGEVMQNYGQAGGYSKMPFTPEQRLYCLSNLTNIREAVDTMEIDKSEKTLLVYYIKNLLNYLTFDRYEREKQMAQNVNWLLEQYSSEKMIYLAHNSHVGNEKGKTGGWLKELLGDKYYIIGCTYFDGTELYKQRALGNSMPVINEGVRGSAEYLLNGINDDCFYLDLRGKRKNPSNEWLFEPLLMRCYGVEAFNYYHEFELTQMSRMYDGIVFTKHSVSL